MTLLRAQYEVRFKQFMTFTVINIAVSPIGLAVFVLISAHGIPTLVAFAGMTLTTTPLTYWAHRQKTFDGDQLHWRTNLQRWAFQRIVMFSAGQVFILGLTQVGLLPIGAVVINGIVQYPLGYTLGKHWAFAEVEEAKA